WVRCSPRWMNSYPQVVPDLSAELSTQVIVVLPHLRVALNQLLDLAAAVDHGGVVAAAEGVADVGQAHVGQLLGQRHGDLPRSRDVAVALLGEQARDPDVVVLGDPLLDIVDGDLLLLEYDQVA